MLLVNFSKVSKDYGGNPIFQDIDLEIIEGERIGLVGENGGGKSTLFKLIAGLEDPTGGGVSRRRNLTIGYLWQEVDPGQSHKTVFEAVSEVTQELVALPLMLSELEAKMADPDVAGDEDALTARVLPTYARQDVTFVSGVSSMGSPPGGWAQAISHLRPGWAIPPRGAAPRVPCSTPRWRPSRGRAGRPTAAA